MPDMGDTGLSEDGKTWWIKEKGRNAIHPANTSVGNTTSKGMEENRKADQVAEFGRILEKGVGTNNYTGETPTTPAMSEAKEHLK